MAWNPEPEIKALRDFANKFDRAVLICISIHNDGESISMESYGKNKPLCDVAKSFGNNIFDAIQNGEIEP